jgi:hypothetical protein
LSFVARGDAPADSEDAYDAWRFGNYGRGLLGPDEERRWTVTGRIIRTMSVVAAVAFGVPGIAAGQPASPGDQPSTAADLATAVRSTSPLSATLDHPGDHDWYFVTGSYVRLTTVTVRGRATTTPSTCTGSSALEVELLNPETQWIATQVFSQDAVAIVSIPSTPDRYFIGIGAHDPACSGLTYTIELARVTVTPAALKIAPRGRRARQPISGGGGDVSCTDAKANVELARQQLKYDETRLHHASAHARRRIRKVIEHDRKVLAKWEKIATSACHRA